MLTTSGEGDESAYEVRSGGGIPEGSDPYTIPDVENFDVPVQKDGEHRLWVYEGGAGYGRAVLFNGDTGQMLGQMETGWIGTEVVMPTGSDLLFNQALYMSRGYRGEATNILELFDRKTLRAAGEIPLPAQKLGGMPSLNHTGSTDDGAFGILQFLTPASSVGIANLEDKSFASRIETAGCAYVFPAGDRRFFTLCGDGSILVITLDDSGAEADRERVSGIFDAQNDPLHGTGVRVGDIWYFVTHRGDVHTIDVGGETLAHAQPWSFKEENEGRAWVPAEMIQNLAVHGPSGTLIVMLADADLALKGGGTDFHRKPGTQLRAYDVETGELKYDTALDGISFAMAVSQDAEPLLYANNVTSPNISVFDALTGTKSYEISGEGIDQVTHISIVEPGQ
ncbi:MAG: amine dehydrogenase large subunit [Pseudomonadota bacterium]